MKEELIKQGVIYTDMETAVREYPDLVQKHFMKCVPIYDQFNIFFDQFSIVEYLKYALSLTYNSTQPACKFTLLYFGAEQPSIKCRLAPSSTIIKVCSNCPDSGEFNLK